MSRSLPSGTVTFLFTDIEGSTRLLDELGPERYAESLAEHRGVLRRAFTSKGGVEVDTQGDAFFVAFPFAEGALAAAALAQAELTDGPIRVRMGIHSGTPLLTAEGYVGMDVHQGARVMGAGHGGQVLVSDATRALLDGSEGLTDLGLHRLKDLTEPQRLWQLGDGVFPPLKTLFQTNLPVQPTALVGRERELGEVMALVRSERLVTLTGAGGSGKTRLALQAAAELTDEFRDGVWWVSLAALRDEELVGPTIAQAVGAKDDLAGHLRGKQILLLIDNFEHLVPAAPLVAELLAATSDVRVLATSRERLAVAAEQEYLVPTMAIDEAAALFTARARRIRDDFEPDEAVAEICRRLDGLPLAIELAAARVKTVGTDQILARLGRSLDLLTAGMRDAPERQQTLRATIEWSYQLLDHEEQQLFASLAVFAGSFSLDAAESICEAGMDTLAGLVDKSLVRRTDDRYFFLETIREFAAEQLERRDDGAALRAGHTRWFVSLASERDAQDADVERMDALDRELDNFRAAMEWSLERGDPNDALTIAVGLARVWELRDHWAEGAAWYTRVVREATEASAIARARVLIEHAVLAAHFEDWESVDRLLEDARGAVFDEGTERDQGRWWLLRGGVEWMGREDAAAGISALESALAAFRSAGDLPQERIAAHHLGETLRDNGDLDGSVEWLTRSIELSRSLGDLMFEAASLHGLGDAWLEAGDDARAEDAYMDSLRASHATRFDGQTALCLAALAATSARRGHLSRAATLWATVEAYETERGAPIHEHERRRYLSSLSAIEPAAPLSLEEAVQYALEPQAD